MSSIKRALKILEDYIKREAEEYESDRAALHRCRDEGYTVDAAYDELSRLQNGYED